jgi:hypothetical protein
VPGRTRGTLPLALLIVAVFVVGVAVAVVRSVKEEGPEVALPSPSPVQTESPAVSPPPESPSPTESPGVPSPEPTEATPSPTPSPPDSLAETGGNPVVYIALGSALVALSAALYRVLRRPTT